MVMKRSDIAGRDATEGTDGRSIPLYPPPQSFVPMKHRQTADDMISELDRLANDPEHELNDMVDRVDEATNEAPSANDPNFHRLAHSSTAPAAPNTSDAAASRTNHTIDLVTAHIMEDINRLRSELDQLENLLLNDAQRIKNQIEAHVDLGRSANEQTLQVSAMIKDMRTRHEKLTATLNN